MALAVGCANRSPFLCTASDQCVSAGAAGVCEPQGFCGFPDSSCPSGFKFEPNAGIGLGGTCVMSDAGMAACGAVGQACCAGTSTCVANAFCSSSSCAACVTDIGLGRHAACLVKYDHTVWCAGDNTMGQLGFGIPGQPQATWVQVHDSTGASITDATHVSAGFEFACAIRAGGTVWCWGNGFTAAAVEVNQTNGTPLVDIVEIANGDDATCARDMTGGVWCWGAVAFGQLGDGTTVARTQAAPVLVAPAGAPFAGAIDLHVGRRQACVRKDGDAVWCWGRNDSGQLGDTSTMNRPNPVMVMTATSVATGQDHTCALHPDGSVWCSGQSWRDRIGNGKSYDSAMPVNYPAAAQVVTAPDGPPFTGATQLAAGGVSCARMQDGTAYCWGDDLYGETGTGAGSTTPVQVMTIDGKPLANIDHLVSHGPHVCAFGTSGELWCWGRNLEGEYGDGTFSNWGFAKPLGFTCP